MKHFFTLCIAFLFFNTLSAQLEPVQWTANAEKISDTEYNLIYSAEIDNHWHLYSQHLPKGGAIPTEFTYDESGLGIDFKLIGEAEESQSITKFDPVFEMDLTYFDYTATFTQKIELLNPNSSNITSEVDFQACDDKQCIFDSQIFNIQLPDTAKNNVLNGNALNSQILEPISWSSKAKKLSKDEYEIEYIAKIDSGWHLYSQFMEREDGPIATSFTFNENVGFNVNGKTLEPDTKAVFDPVFDMDIKYFSNEARFTQIVKITDSSLKAIPSEVFFMVCDDTKCLAPTTFVFNTPLDGSVNVLKESLEVDDKSQSLSNALNLNVTGWDNFEAEEVKEKSNFMIFILGFLGGLIALLTPCVFPMIPLTVSFFTKSSGNGKKGLANAMLYGFFIFLIYVLLSLPFHVLDSLDPEILNNVSTNVTLNIIFFVIFIAFAFSFFGYYELTLPASWSNALDSKANKIGGWIGVFFMALTLAIVSFSCTGPILGTLLGSSLSSDGGAIQLTLGMSGFGLALALPFTLFAMFPKWLNSLPKSGGWLNTVKVVLGFIELALALKFLSNADLVEHWGLLKREVFIGLWIIIGIGLLLYLLGKIKFPHDGPFQKISFSKWSFIFLVFAFVVYLIPGLTNTKYANLELLSGFPPPMFYSLYEKDSECPLSLNCYKDLESGIEAAKAENKPIMLDFTGWACVNCRKMEEQVWSQDKVYDVLNEDYIIVSLYVDDRKLLQKEEQFQFKKANGSLKSIKTIGDKWATLQTLNFKNNSQPYYVLLNHDMELLNSTTAYTPDADEYYNWLIVGLENFEE